MGRAHWLEQDLDGSLPWLERAVELSPNFAQAHYVHGLVDTLSGRTGLARVHTDVAISLSPLDPMYYAMLATQARFWVADVRERCPGFRAGHFFDAFPYADGAAKSGLEALLRRLGF